jgi:hypothetical protein
MYSLVPAMKYATLPSASELQVSNPILSSSTPHTFSLLHEFDHFLHRVIVVR